MLTRALTCSPGFAISDHDVVAQGHPPPYPAPRESLTPGDGHPNPRPFAWGTRVLKTRGFLASFAIGRVIFDVVLVADDGQEVALRPLVASSRRGGKQRSGGPATDDPN
jgi:hypothetical protein